MDILYTYSLTLAFIHSIVALSEDRVPVTSTLNYYFVGGKEVRMQLVVSGSFHCSWTVFKQQRDLPVETSAGVKSYKMSPNMGMGEGCTHFSATNAKYNLQSINSKRNLLAYFHYSSNKTYLAFFVVCFKALFP